jgi:hypothetical protein
VRAVLHNLITRIESYTFAIPVAATMGLARAKVWKTDEKAWNIRCIRGNACTRRARVAASY